MRRCMGELNQNKHPVNSSFLIKNHGTGKRPAMNKRSTIQSDCCDASIIIVGEKAYKCVQCGAHCAIGTDYERMSYMSKSIS
jgi:hypothetical protein